VSNAAISWRRCASRSNGQVQKRNMLSVDIWLSIPMIA
jgi:hypothetical protein